MPESYYRGSPMSRGFATAPIRRGGETSPVAGIGAIVSDLVAAAMYDPEKDPRLKQAELYGVKTESERFALEEAKRAAGRAEQARTIIGSVANAAGLGAAAPQLAAADYGVGAAGDTALLLSNLMGPGKGFGQSETDAAFRAAGGRPDQTREAFGYDVDTRSGDNRYDADQRLAGTKYDANTRASTAVEVAGMSETAARARAFGALPPERQAQAVGPTKEETAGSMLAADEGNLSPEQRAAVYGAEPKIDGRQASNYVAQGPDGRTVAQGRTLDGRTDATTGEPLPQNAQIVKREATGSASDVLTNSQRGNLELEAVGYEDFRSLLGEARNIAQADPTLFGTTGNVRRLAQGAAAQMANIGLLRSGGDANLDSAYQEAYANMAANGVDMALFGAYDPNLNDITKLSTLLTYGAASVLAGQEGRSVSDRDVATFRQVVGDPSSWLGDQRSFLSGLDLMDRILSQRAGNREGLLGGRGAARPAAAPPAIDPETEALLQKYGG